MNGRGPPRLTLLLAIELLLAACGGPVPGTGDDSAPPADSNSPPSVVHSATGTFNSIDREAHTVNISHEPVPSAQWPAMTMNFQYSDTLVIGDIEPGQRVAFEFTTEGSGTVTKIEQMP